MTREKLAGFGATGVPTKETFVIDNSKATVVNDSNGQTPTSRVSDTASAFKALAGIKDAVRGHTSVRVTALTVPATLLAAETPALEADPGDLLGDALGGLLDAGGVLIEQQPLLTVAVAVGLVGAGYVKAKGDLSRDDDGFAPKRKLRGALGARQLVKNRKVLRPSLADVPARKVDTNAVGTYLGRDRKTGLHLYMAIEDSSVMVAPPGGGKTAKLANWVIDAPGAVLATSVKVDIVELTQTLRARVGRILIWNPQGIGGYASNVAWDPVIGCSDPERGVERAMRRANYLLDGSDATKGVENRNFWETASYSVLKAFLWAADAADLTLLDVARWSKSFRNDEAIKILEKFEHPDPYDRSRPVAPRGWKDDLLQVQKVEGKPTTGENVFGTLSKTFMFLDTPQVQEVIENAHRPGAGLFDIRDYLTSQDTLYLLGRDTGRGGIGPLFSCLTGEIYEAARDLAPLQPGGRLDAPWSLILDEAALICSVPLEKWTSDARGLGIAIHAVFQSRSQIRERYGREAARTIWNNMVKLILGGLADEEDLKGLSELCGWHWEKQETHSSSPGSDGTTRKSSSTSRIKVDTMTPANIFDLEPGEILVLRRNLGGPVVVRYTAVWDRRDVKEVEKMQKREAKAAAKANRRKAAEVPDLEGTASPWASPEPAGLWAPAASATDAADPVPGERSRLRVVFPQPEHSPVIPEMPDYAPTEHLDQQQLREQQPAEPVQLHKTGTDDSAASSRSYADSWDDDDQGGF